VSGKAEGVSSSQPNFAAHPFDVVQTSPDHENQALNQAWDRVSFLLWALEEHRKGDKMRNDHWRRIEADYVRSLEDARRDLKRLQDEAS
jgi:hypothetical protein